MTRDITIAGRVIGPDHSPYFIAELSGNHKGELARAFRIMDAAKEAGADAVKLQTYTADTITIDHDGPGFFLKEGLWAGRTLHDLYREAHTPWEWHGPIFDYAARIGIPVFSSPFDSTAVDLLEKLGAPAFKIASFEIIDLPLVRDAARLGKPVILSTGMASLGEIGEALSVVREAGAPALLLHCTSGYPTPPEECDLRTIAHLSEAFDVAVGLSDHTLGIGVPVAAVALGATVIEKHFTLSRAEGGVDADFSLEPQEFAAMVQACKTAFAAVGQVDYRIKPSEASGLNSRRSLYVVEDVKGGETLTERNVRSIRPGFGLLPKYLPEIVGRIAARDLKKGEPLAWSMVAS
ncbi:MAG: pseudaminic acid synthase [Rhodospirillaceae bacterium]|nr:pseudaminic acid synthase [Rhodospirillales bacterium]